MASDAQVGRSIAAHRVMRVSATRNADRSHTGRHGELVTRGGATCHTRRPRTVRLPMKPLARVRPGSPGRLGLPRSRQPECAQPPDSTTYPEAAGQGVRGPTRPRPVGTFFGCARFCKSGQRNCPRFAAVRGLRTRFCHARVRRPGKPQVGRVLRLRPLRLARKRAAQTSHIRNPRPFPAPSFAKPSTAAKSAPPRQPRPHAVDAVLWLPLLQVIGAAVPQIQGGPPPQRTNAT